MEGMGYVLPEIEVNASSDSDSDSWSDPWGSTSDPWGDSGEGSPSQPSGGSGTGNNNGGSQGGGSYNPVNSGTNNPYPQTTKTISGTAVLYQLVEGIGIQATFLYKCGISISGYTMSLGVTVQPGSFTDRSFWATAVVKNDGGSEKYYKLSYNEQGYIYETGWSVIGDVSFELPKSGNVTVDLRIGYNYDTGIGNTNNSTIIHIYPF